MELILVFVFGAGLGSAVTWVLSRQHFGLAVDLAVQRERAEREKQEALTDERIRTVKAETELETRAKLFQSLRTERSYDQVTEGIIHKTHYVVMEEQLFLDNQPITAPIKRKKITNEHLDQNELKAFVDTVKSITDPLGGSVVTLPKALPGR